MYTFKTSSINWYQKLSNFPFIINATKSEKLQGKCLQFWLLINVAKLCFGLKSIQTALLSQAFDFFGYYKVSEYIKLNEFEPCYQLWTWKTFLIESLSFIFASHFFFVVVLTTNKAESIWDNWVLGTFLFSKIVLFDTLLKQNNWEVCKENS